jgi:signal transduction histidine kinase
MRTDRGLGRFYAAGWLISVAGMAVAGFMWQLHVKEVEQRAEEAVRTRDEVARRKAVEERLRIARELHDSLTHSISVIQVQSGVAVHLARKRGEEVPAALLAIEEASADAARELRSTLGVLRAQDECDGTGLNQLDRLVARTRAAGLAVTVAVTGAPRTLPPEVDQAAYRIVQEALTNVGRHAGSAGGVQVGARVELGYSATCLTVQVDDDGAAGSGGAAGGGSGARTPGTGLGLLGMRERVSALGGRLSAVAREGGGFRVRAEIPAP